MIILVLLLLLIMVFVLPFIFGEIEENLEFFLFVMGVLVAITSGEMCQELVIRALKEPLMISLVVLISGILFEVFKAKIKNFIYFVLNTLPLKVFIFLVVIMLGLLSSIITAIISSLILVEILDAVPLKRNCKINVTIVACFAIGLGAALTPVGEPLSTIAVSKMNKDFWYLFSLLAIYIIPGILVMGILSTFFVDNKFGEHYNTRQSCQKKIIICDSKCEKYVDVVSRSCKVYLFVMALHFLGEGFNPLINNYILKLNTPILYWINMISAVLDNATLAAAELSPRMTPEQVQSILMALLVSGGMLIPGNIPNIISANKLKITSREWALTGFPLGILVMTVYFLILF